jgi:protein tyrosine phosphatase (PTP) superfamily phosphohydrolase (DUF442 family)
LHRLGLCIGSFLLATLSSCSGFQPIQGGGAYRSSQLSADELAYRIRTSDIRSMICLRGERVGKPWYEEQEAVASARGVPSYYLGWSAYGVGDDRIVAYLRLLDQLPRPILIHCLAGRDRTGLAAAIYRHHVLGHEPESADDELRFVPYGHVPLFGYEAMDEAFARYVRHYELFAAAARREPFEHPDSSPESSADER